MKLTPNQSNKAIKELEKFVPHVCSMCRSSDVRLNDTIFELREYNSGNLIIGGPSTIFPVVALNCVKCGHTDFFNAVLLGVLDKDGKNING